MSCFSLLLLRRILWSTVYIASMIAVSVLRL
jgi:hypothetical protein